MTGDLVEMSAFASCLVCLNTVKEIALLMYFKFTQLFSPLVSSVCQMFTIGRKGRVSHWFSDFCFPWTETELTWDISDWGSEWDSADYKQEDASSASMVCAMSIHFSCCVVISALVSALVTNKYMK